jgi:hypothetical protein
VLYVATVHFNSPKWIDIQLGHLRRTISEPFQTFAVLNGIDPEFHGRFDRVIDAEGPHEGKLNLLAAEIGAVARPDDILIFLDGDAFPIADPMPTIHTALSETSLVAVRRDENSGDRPPHPCFCAVRLSEWERLHGDWSRGAVWSNANGKVVTDVGGNLLAALERTHSRWTPLLRTNKWDPHPLWFGIYGDVVYHHGAGFRPPKGRVERESMPVRHRGGRLPVIGVAIRVTNRYRIRRWDERRTRRSEEMSNDWYERIRSDPEFFQVLREPPVSP